MSYRNPQQNVDTQSAQGIANLQRTIAGTFGGIVQKEVADQKDLAIQQKKLADKRANELKEYEKLEQQVALGIKKHEIDNPDLRLGESMAPLVNSYSDIMTRINSGAVTDPKEIAALKAQANDILTIPARIGKMLESISATDLLMTEIQKNAGGMGGLDLSQKSPMPEAMRVLMNKAKGDRSTRIEFENGKYKAYIDVTPEGGEKVTLTEDQLAAYLSGESKGVQVIPDTTKRMEKLAKTYVYDFVDGKKVNKPDAYSEEKTREIKDKQGNVIRIETYRTANRDYLTKSVKNIVTSEIYAMNTNEKVAFMNNIISPDDRKYDVNNIEEHGDALEKGYTDYWLNVYAKDQVISTRNVALPRDSKSTKSKITPEIKTNIEAIGESLKTEPHKVFKGRKFGTSGLKVEDVELKDGKIKVILDDGTVTTKNKGVSTTEMKVKEIEYDLSDAADVRNLAGTLYKENSEEYNILLNYLFLDAESRTTGESNDKPFRTWTP